MKGIILAGGLGSRLYPLTAHTLKQLLPVYDKPMIYYPLATLMQFDIKEVLIISTPAQAPNIEKLIGDGSKLGMKITYALEHEPKGIANAFVIGKDFVGDDDVCLILGDNVFYMNDELTMFKEEVQKNKGKNATIFVYKISEDHHRFGIVEFDENLKAISIEEKPKQPKSDFASVGLYFFPSDVVGKSIDLKPSARGEMEITDVNNLYLDEGRMNVVPMGRGNAWLDAGTPDSLMESSHFVHVVEKRQGIKIACIEEIAYKKGWINKEQLLDAVKNLKDCEYKNYIVRLSEEN